LCWYWCLLLVLLVLPPPPLLPVLLVVVVVVLLLLVPWLFAPAAADVAASIACCFCRAAFASLAWLVASASAADRICVFVDRRRWCANVRRKFALLIASLSSDWTLRFSSTHLAAHSHSQRSTTQRSTVKNDERFRKKRRFSSRHTL
jgi:hypothetical protein